MTEPALTALLDTLLPGDSGSPALPPFSQADVDTVLLAASAQPVLAAMDRDSFIRASTDERVAVMRRIEQDLPDEFRAVLNRALAAYYQAPRVLAALGWRSEPPQPTGHRLDGDDAASLVMLDRVRGRGAIWRS